MAHRNVFSETEEVIESLRNEPELMEALTHKSREHLVLRLRNIAVSVAFVLFIFSFFLLSIHTLLRGIAYLSGALAYFFEILLLSDFFSAEIDHRELFMAYCFGPLYILMGIAYILEG